MLWKLAVLGGATAASFRGDSSQAMDSSKSVQNTQYNVTKYLTPPGVADSSVLGAVSQLMGSAANEHKIVLDAFQQSHMSTVMSDLKKLANDINVVSADVEEVQISTLNAGNNPDAACRDRAKYKADFKNCMVEQHRTRGANLDPVFGLAMSGHNLDENDHDSYHAGDQTHCMNKVEKDIAKTCILSQDILCLGNAKKSAIRAKHDAEAEGEIAAAGLQLTLSTEEADISVAALAAALSKKPSLDGDAAVPEIVE